MDFVSSHNLYQARATQVISAGPGEDIQAVLLFGTEAFRRLISDAAQHCESHGPVAAT